MTATVTTDRAQSDALRKAGNQRTRGLFPGHITAEQASRLGLRIQRGAMTPQQIGIFLGYKVQRNKGGFAGPTAKWLAEIEAAVMLWLPAWGGSVVLHVELGTSQSSHKDNPLVERYIDFRKPSTGPAPFTPRHGAECVAYCEWPRRAPWKPANPVKYARRSRTPKFGGAA